MEKHPLQDAVGKKVIEASTEITIKVNALETVLFTVISILPQEHNRCRPATVFY